MGGSSSANGFDSSMGESEYSASRATFSSVAISPIDSALSQAIAPALAPVLGKSAAKIVNSQNDSPQNSAVTGSGMINSATPLASSRFEQGKPSAGDPTTRVEAQDGIHPPVVIDTSGQIGSAAEDTKLPTDSTELAQCAPGQLAEFQVSEFQVSVPVDPPGASDATPGGSKIGEADVTTPTARDETPGSSPHADAPTGAPMSAKPETLPAIDIFSEQDPEISHSGAAQDKHEPAASVAKNVAVAPSSAIPPTLARMRISEMTLEGASCLENPTNLAPITSPCKSTNNMPISKDSSPPTLGPSSAGILTRPASNSAQDNDVSADSAPVKATNSTGQVSDKTTSAQPSQTAQTKPASAKADSDSGNSSASAAPDTNPAPAAMAPSTPASITTAATTLVAPGPDGSSQSFQTSVPSSPEKSLTPSAGQASIPAPSDSPAVHTGTVQMAQMVNKAAQSEMRVELNTSAFGSVEVRTTVRANDVGVLIGSEKGDLRSLLANELPGIASNLQQQSLRLNQVNFHQGFASANQMSSGGGGSQWRSFASRTGTTTTPVPIDPSESSEAGEAYRGLSTNGKLSILA